MDKKIVFFDADGTVCDIEKGVPDSAVRAIKSLVNNGHEAWLCTGRSRALVADYLEQIPFTGMITACGATIEKGNTRLFNREMPVEIAEHSVRVLRENKMIPVMEGADFMYYDKDEYTNDINWYCDCITKALGEKWRPITGYEKNMHINKISAKKTEESNVEAACQELSKYYDIIRHENNAFVGNTIEMIPKGFSKAVGIAAVLKIQNIPWENTIVFGDSNNDLSMFEYAAYKVAMGNGSPKILDMADYITTDMFHYGIRNGLQYLKLI